MLYESKVRRSTGTLVTVHDTADISVEEEPFTLICQGVDPENDPHGGVLTVYTLTQAREMAPHPDEWCPTCQEDN